MVDTEFRPTSNIMGAVPDHGEHAHTTSPRAGLE
jgi:hypothetical protein